MPRPALTPGKVAVLGDGVKAPGSGLSSEQMWSKLDDKTYTSTVKFTLYLETGALVSGSGRCVFFLSHYTTLTALKPAPDVWLFHPSNSDANSLGLA